jgi:hypothetical protein
MTAGRLAMKHLAWASLCASLLFACSRPQVPPDLVPQVDAMASSEPGVWQEAKVRLVCEGSRGLDALEAGLLNGKISKPRAREAVALAMQFKVRWADVEAHRALARLVRPGVEEGLDLARKLEADPAVARECQSTKLRDSILEMGGLAVPGAELLMASEKPAARNCGVELINLLPAPSVRSAVEKLRDDPGTFKMLHDDYTTTDSVGATATKDLDKGQLRLPAGPGSELEEIAIGRSYSLANAIRQLGGLDAKSFDEWWGIARPVWRTWWTMAGDGKRPADRDAWDSYVQSLMGYQMKSVPSPGVHKLLVNGPEGTQVKLSAFKPCREGQACPEPETLAAGPVPLTFQPETPTPAVRIAATRPDGSKVELIPTCCTNATFEVTILPSH